MSTTTPRLGLVIPDPSESMALGDNQLAENYRKIDEGIGVSAGTSFPLSPFVGKIFRRTDESKTYYWNGSVWIEWASSFVPTINGLVGAATSVATGATTTTEVLAVSTSFSAIQNRRYLIKACLTVDFTVAVENFIRTALRWGTSAPTGASTLIREFRGYTDGVNCEGRNMAMITEFLYGGVNQTIHIGALYRCEVASTVNTGGGVSPDKNSNTITVYDYGT